MNLDPKFLLLYGMSAPLVVCQVGVERGFAQEYQSIEEAQRTLFPQATRFEADRFPLTEEQVARIETDSGVSVYQPEVSSWTARNTKGEIEGYVLLDNVIGKHEYITYAVGLNAEGSVRGVEILTYRESIGGEVRDPQWRQQFAEKNAKSTLRLEQDIQNISGATLSCKHVTEGVRRIAVTYEVAIKPRVQAVATLPAGRNL